MKLSVLAAALCLAHTMASAEAMTPEQRKEAFRKLVWHVGPAAEMIAGKATLKTADDQTEFLDEKNSRRFLELTGNLPEDGNFILLKTDADWWADFSFNPSGYVKDGEKIDADELLKTLKSYDEAANAERKRLGLRPLYTEGWHVPPHYDTATKRLEWGLKLRSEDRISVNYTIRILGRTGVMNATLISDPQSLDSDIVSFRKTLEGFDFNSGEHYSEFRPGDHVAEYGLAALITGGAAAVATKKGFWAIAAGFLASAWKAIVAVAVAAGAGLKSMFSRKKNDRDAG